jgi:hypothetical protein
MPFKSQAQRRKFAAGRGVHKKPVRSVGEGQGLSVSLTSRKASHASSALPFATFRSSSSVTANKVAAVSA